MTGVIREVDDGLVSLKKVMDQDTNFDKLLLTAIDSSEKFARSLGESLDAMEEFAKQGYLESDLKNLTEAGLVAANVAELTSSQASEYLTSSLIQWKKETSEAMSVIDSWNEIANNYATTSEKLAQGHTRAGATAKLMNLTFDETNAIIGSVTAATKQSGTEIGNFLKNVLPRLTGKPAADALDMVGVDLLDAKTGDMRHVVDIYQEVADKFKTMDKYNQSIVVEGLAGKFHGTRMAAFLQDLSSADSMYRQMLDSSLNSQGSALEENETYMESITARAALARVEFEKMSLAFGDTFLTETMIQTLKGMGSLFDMTGKLSKSIGGLPLILGVTGLAFGGMSKNVKNLNLVMNVSDAITKRLSISNGVLAASIRGLVASTGVGVALLALGGALQFLLSKMGEHREAQERLDQKNRELTDSFSENKESITSLSAEYEKLESKINSGIYESTDLERYTELQNQLAELMPTLVVGEDQYGNKIFASSENLKGKVSLLERQLELQNKLDAKERKEEAQADYDAASKEYEKYAKKIDSVFSKNKDRNRLNALGSEYSLTNLNEIEQVLQAIDKLEKKSESKGISRKEEFGLDALRNIRDNYNDLSMQAEDSKYKILSANNELISSVLEIDKTYSNSSKAMINDFTLFVSNTEMGSQKINSVLSGLRDSMENSHSFKDAFKGYGLAIDEYKEKLKSGLKEEDLEKYANKATSAFTSVKEELLNLARENGIAGEDLNKLTANLESSSLKALSSTINWTQMSKETGKSIEELKLELGMLGEEFDGVGDSAEASGDKLDDLVKTYDDALSNIKSLNGILNDLNDTQQISSDKISLLIEKYPHLLAYINDEATLYKKVQEEIAKEEKIAKQAMLAKLQYNEQFYKSAISSHSEYVKSFNEHYKVDLKQFKTLAEAKATVESRLLKGLTESWNKYYSSTANALATVKMATGGIMGALTGGVQAGYAGARDMISAVYSKPLADFNDIFIDSIDSLTGGTIASNGFADATKKAESSSASANKEYENSIYVTDKFKQALEKVNLELEKQQAIQASFPKHSKEAQNALKQELKLNQDKLKLIQNQTKELNKQISQGKIASTGIVPTSSTSSGGSYSGKYSSEINKAASKYGVDPNLIAAIIQAESSFNPNARSSAGAQGLMQLMPATARSLGVKNAYDPAQNIMGGTKYIADQLKAFGGNLEKALAAYNAGPGNVRKYGGIPPFKETQNYIQKILGSYTKGMTSANSDVASYYFNNFRQTSQFGDTQGRNAPHRGLDFANGKQGDPVKALRGGKVITATYSKSAGYWVVVEQDDGTVAKYMHMQQGLNVKAGQQISAGQQLGKVGNTGQSNGAHVHIQIEQDGKAIDPLSYMQKLGADSSKAIAQGLSEVDNAKSTVIQLEQDALALQQQIQQLYMDIVESHLAGIDRIKNSYADDLAKVDLLMKRENSTSKEWTKQQLKKEEILSKQIAQEKEAVKYIQQQIKSNKDLNKAQKSLLEDQLVDRYQALYSLEGNLLDERLSMIDQAIDAYKKAAEAQKDASVKAIDDLINEINKSADEESYKKKLDDAQKDRQELLDEIASWALDDSDSAKKRIFELNKQLEEQDESIFEMQEDKAKQDRIDNLEEQKTEIENNYEELINDERKFAKMRSDIIDGNTKQIQKDLDKYFTNIKKNTEILGKSISNNIIDLINQANSYMGNKNFKPIKIAQAKEGGILPSWGSSGKAMIVHEEEMISNKGDTKNILKALDLSSRLLNNLKLPKLKLPELPVHQTGSTVSNYYDIDLRVDNLKGTKNDAEILLDRIVTEVKLKGGNL